MAPCIAPRRCHTAEAVDVTCGLACRARDASGGKRLATQAKNMIRLSYFIRSHVKSSLFMTCHRIPLRHLHRLPSSPAGFRSTFVWGAGRTNEQHSRVDRLHVSGEAGCLHNALHPPLAAAKLFRNCGRGNAIGSELDDGCDERWPFCAKGTTQGKGKDEGKDEAPHTLGNLRGNRSSQVKSSSSSKTSSSQVGSSIHNHHSTIFRMVNVES